MSSKLSEPHGRSGNVGNAPTQRHRTRARPAIKSPAHEAEYSTNGGGAPARVSVEWEDEEAWLRARIIRLRTILRYAKDPQVEIGLKEFIADAPMRRGSIALTKTKGWSPLLQNDQTSIVSRPIGGRQPNVGTVREWRG